MRKGRVRSGFQGELAGPVGCADTEEDLFVPLGQQFASKYRGTGRHGTVALADRHIRSSGARFSKHRGETDFVRIGYENEL